MIKFIERYKEKKAKKLRDTIYNEVSSYIGGCINGDYYVTINNFYCDERDRAVNIVSGTPCRFISITESRAWFGPVFKIGISYFSKEEKFAFFCYGFILKRDVNAEIENFRDYINRHFMKISNDN